MCRVSDGTKGEIYGEILARGSASERPGMVINYSRPDDVRAFLTLFPWLADHVRPDEIEEVRVRPATAIIQSLPRGERFGGEIEGMIFGLSGASKLWSTTLEEVRRARGALGLSRTVNAQTTLTGEEDGVLIVWCEAKSGGKTFSRIAFFVCRKEFKFKDFPEIRAWMTAPRIWREIKEFADEVRPTSKGSAAPAEQKPTEISIGA